MSPPPPSAAPSSTRELPRQSLPPYLTALVVLAVPLGITLGAWYHQREMERLEASATFSREASRVSAAIEERLNDYAQLLRSGQGFLAATPAVDRGAWRRFSQHLGLERNLPGLHVLGYAPRIAAEGGVAFVRRMREKEGQTNYTLRPSGERPEYFPIAFMEPENRVHTAFGFDLATEPARMAALGAARDSGTVTLSGPIQLLADIAGQKQPALLMAAPVYREDPPPLTTAARQQALGGFVYAVFRVEDFIASLGLSGKAQISLRILDDSATERRPRLLYGQDDAPTPTALREERSFYFGGRSWQLHFTDPESGRSGREMPASLVMLASGTAISFLLAFLTLHLGTRRALAEQLAHQLSREWEETNVRLRSVFSAMPDMIFELDRGRRLRHYHSPRERDLLTLPADALGKALSDILPSGLAAQLEEACRQIGGGESLQVLEFQLPRGDGDICDYEARITAIGEGGYLVVIRNVSDFRRAQLALEVANRKMTAVFDSATEVSIIATDTEGIITVFNRGAEKMLGYRAEEMIGRSSLSVLHVPEEVALRGEELSQEFGWTVADFDVFVTLARLTGVERREWTYRRKDGSRLAVNLVVTAVYDEADNVVGFLGVAVDISALKRAEAELRRHRDHLQELVSERSADLLLAKEAADQANHTKSEFLANMSHELRTPMHAILSFAGLGASRAAGVPGAEKLHHYFLRIKESGERLLALVNDLLDLSKLEAGKMSFDPRPINLRPLVREAAAEMESLLLEKSLHLSIGEDGPAEVNCDPLRFGQLIRNLLSNAVKFSPEGGSIQVRFQSAWLASGRRTADQGRRPAVEMTVSDEGIGIPVAERELVFDKFAQSSKTKTGAGGTGLGLAICREIALAHRGTIVARANSGPGCCLAVTLPLAETAIVAEEHA